MTEEVALLIQQEGLSAKAIEAFRDVVYEHYRRSGRLFPWRTTDDPYCILVSEVMLQQTQTARVLAKYERFIDAFPDLASLAAAPLHAVLEAWQGLGYNRRALALHRLAQTVVGSFAGRLTSSPELLVQLPGVGRYTAGAVAALAFNQPTVFVDTNIRAVFLHFFFPGQQGVSDRQVLPLVEATLDRASPREWYYALFDYGAMLKVSENHTRRSAHYRRQTPFKGSNRELRGQVLRLLLAHPGLSEAEIGEALQEGAGRVGDMLRQLEREGFLTIEDGRVNLR